MRATKMKKLKRTILLLILTLSAMTSFYACSKSNELAPKTGDLNSEYLLQKGPLLSNEDRELINKRLEEYSEATDL